MSKKKNKNANDKVAVSDIGRADVQGMSPPPRRSTNVPPNKDMPPLPVFVFKNKKFRQVCVGAMIIAVAIALAYVLFCFINYEHCRNYPRMYCRLALTCVFAVETALFAHRNSVYMEIGGDFALARRCGTAMIMLIIFSSLVEAYYVSASLAANSTIVLRIGSMIVIFLCGAASLLPIIDYQYVTLNFFAVRVTVVLGILASLTSFFLGFFFVGLHEMELYDVVGFKQVVSRVLDSFNPLFLINCINGVIILIISHISFMKEQRKNSKYLPKDLTKDDFAEEKPVDDDDEDDDDDEYIGL